MDLSVIRRLTMAVLEQAADTFPPSARCGAAFTTLFGSGPVVLQPIGPTAHWSYDPIVLTLTLTLTL